MEVNYNYSKCSFSVFILSFNCSKLKIDFNPESFDMKPYNTMENNRQQYFGNGQQSVMAPGYHHQPEDFNKNQANGFNQQQSLVQGNSANFLNDFRKTRLCANLEVQFTVL